MDSQIASRRKKAQGLVRAFTMLVMSKADVQDRDAATDLLNDLFRSYEDGARFWQARSLSNLALQVSVLKSISYALNFNSVRVPSPLGSLIHVLQG